MGSQTLGQDLVPLLHRLQDIFCQAGLNGQHELKLPEIAVVGSQSSGKSSVLEALSPKPGKPAEWGEFLHLPSEVFTDFEKIREEIEAETNREVGGSKNISEKPIRLKISSPNVVTMTLVDLPGMTKVPVGDQPRDIEKQIRDMAMKYICKDTCLILAVSPANSDLANSDALMLAREVDPRGNRTIGVITKLDIMDRGTNAVAYLRGEVVPLKYGYYGVVNRSQADINEKQVISYAKAQEQQFFRSRTEYREVDQRCGVTNLSMALSTLLSKQMKREMPKLKAVFEQKLKEGGAQLKRLGQGTPQGRSAQSSLLLQLINSFSTALKRNVDGSDVEAAGTKQLVGGARIRYIFQEVFAQSLDALDPSSFLSDSDIGTAIENSGGTRGVLLLPDEPFQMLVKQAIERLFEPCQQCLALVLREIQKMVCPSAAVMLIGPPVVRVADGDCQSAEAILLDGAQVEVCLQQLDAFPNMKSAVKEATYKYLESGMRPAESMINSLVQCHLGYINMAHPRFIGGGGALKKAEQLLQEKASASSAAAAAGDDRVSESLTGANGLEGFVRGQTPPRRGPAAEPSGTGGGLMSLIKRATGHTPATKLEELYTMDEDSGKITLLEPPLEIAAVQGEFSAGSTTLLIATTRALLESYYEIVRDSLQPWFVTSGQFPAAIRPEYASKAAQDMVPKAAMNFLVNTISSGLEQHLIQPLYREERFTELLSEPPELAKKRQQVLEARNAFQAALSAIENLASDLGNGRSSVRTSDATGKGKENDSPAQPSHEARRKAFEQGSDSMHRRTMSTGMVR
eukprot:gene503-896_t